MAATCGKDGKVLIATHEVLIIRKWALTATNETIDLAYFQASGLTKKVCGPYGWSGTFEGDCDISDDATGAQKDLMDKCLAGTSVTLALYVAADQYFSGTAYIKSFDAAADATPGNVATVSFSFEGDGDLTITNT